MGENKDENIDNRCSVHPNHQIRTNGDCKALGICADTNTENCYSERIRVQAAFANHRKKSGGMKMSEKNKNKKDSSKPSANATEETKKVPKAVKYPEKGKLNKYGFVHVSKPVLEDAGLEKGKEYDAKIDKVDGKIVITINVEVAKNAAN